MAAPIPPCFAAFIALMLPGIAKAHDATVHGAGFLQGLLHPLGGADHVLATVAVGLWAAQRGGRLRWSLPALFVAISALAVLGGAHGAGVGFVGHGLALSVLLLGVLIAAALRLPEGTSLAVVGAAAMLHGLAHGIEAHAGAALAYGAGFVLATALLHALGMSAALIARSTSAGHLLRAAGGAVAAAGTYLLFA